MHIVITTDELIKNLPLPQGLSSTKITVISTEGKGKQKMSMEEVVDFFNAMQARGIKMETIKMTPSKEALMLYLGFKASTANKETVFYITSDKNLCKTINDNTKALNIADKLCAVVNIKSALNSIYGQAMPTEKKPRTRKAAKTEKPEPAEIEEKTAEEPEEIEEKPKTRGRKAKQKLDPKFVALLKKSKIQADIVGAGQKVDEAYGKIWTAVANSNDPISFDMQLRIRLLNAKLATTISEKLKDTFKSLKEIVGDDNG